MDERIAFLGWADADSLGIAFLGWAFTVETWQEITGRCTVASPLAGHSTAASPLGGRSTIATPLGGRMQ